MSIRKERVLLVVNLIANARDLVRAVELVGGPSLDRKIAESLIEERNRKGAFASHEEIETLVADPVETQAIGSLDRVDPEELLGRVGVETDDPARDLGPLLVSTFGRGAGVVAQQRDGIGIDAPRRDPPDDRIPDTVTWIGGQTRTLGRSIQAGPGNCQTVTVQQLRTHLGPMQKALEGPYKRVLISRPTGSSALSGSGTLGPVGIGAGVERPQFELVLVDLCIEHRWRLFRNELHRIVLEICPGVPPRLVSSQMVQERNHWEMLSPSSWPIPCPEGEIVVGFTSRFREGEDLRETARAYGVQPWGFSTYEGVEIGD